MSYKAIKRVVTGACLMVAVVLAAAPGGALAATTCTAPTLDQPFLSFGDPNWYTLVPGQSTAGFNASGWTLTGGAKVVPTTRYDGTIGYVLDLPTGATAVSPTMCVNSSYPTARTMVRNVLGSAGVSASVAYLDAGPFSKPQTLGTIKVLGSTWSLSQTLNIHSIVLTGWRLGQFTFAATGTGSEYQLYSFYVDPRML
jgi:hypothetical protein